MKKLLVFVLTLCIVFSFSSCLGENPQQETTTQATTAQAPVSEEDSNFSYLVYRDYVEIVEYTGSLTYVEIPAEYKGKPVVSFGKVFSNNLRIVSVSISSNICEIVDNAFSNCVNLTSVTIEPGNLTSIHKNAFFGCSELSHADIPATVTDIHEDAFIYCTAGLIIYGESGSAAQAFANTNSSIYFREKNVEPTTAQPSTSQDTTNE